MTSRSASSVLTPPAALTPMCGDTERRIRIRSSCVAPVAREAGRCLDEVRAGGLSDVAGADLLVVRQVGVLEDDLDDGAGGVGDVHDRSDVGLDLGIPPGLEGSDLEHHVELTGAIADRARPTRTPS